MPFDPAPVVTPPAPAPEPDNVLAASVASESDVSVEGSAPLPSPVAPTVVEPLASLASSITVAHGSVVAVRGDGRCGFYCASAIGRLAIDEEGLANDWVPCFDTQLHHSREQMIENLKKWRSQKREWTASEEELDAFTLMHIAETVEDFCKRVRGEIPGKDVCGVTTRPVHSVH